MYTWGIKKYGLNFLISQKAKSQQGLEILHIKHCDVQDFLSLLWLSLLRYQKIKPIFFYALSVHFDIWNKIREKKFHPKNYDISENRAKIHVGVHERKILG